MLTGTRHVEKTLRDRSSCGDLSRGKVAKLLTKQVKNYGEMNVSWQEIAQKLFPQVPNRLHMMGKARENMLAVCRSRVLIVVIYIGIGCGAGWATTYDA